MSSRGSQSVTQNKRTPAGRWLRSRGRGSYGGNAQGRSQTRQMELVASVSRSSGLEKDGDTLKDYKIQEEYRTFIKGKLDNVLRKYHRRTVETEAEASHRVEEQENVLILFRKLREGISSTMRRDHFALEVYETSLFLATAFASPRHSSAIVHHLVPDLYLSCPAPHQNLIFTIFVSLIHQLVINYPSQGPYVQQLDSIPLCLFPKDSEARKWIASLSASLRTRNYVRFEEQSVRSTLLRVLGLQQEQESKLETNLGLLAICTAVDGLRIKVRETAWTVMRSVYRELTCHVESETRDWLGRSLCLHSVLSEDFAISLDHWLEKQHSLGAVRPKEGVQGRWIVCKIRM
ncbi:hypothetical protein AX17_006239 [Amanita inopinata Kibby_2008]|nr:hypothetical protein AX17_006239 [Amanita inopinata Kibby_2008]